MAIKDLFKRKKDEQTIKLEPLKGVWEIPQKIDDFKEWHYKVLRRLKNHPVKEGFSGLMTLEVDIPRFIPVLIKLGLIRIGSYEESLTLLKVDILKEILRKQGLKVSGSKNILVERILNEANKSDVQKMDIYSDIYMHTDFATKIIAESYDKFEQERIQFFEKVVNLIIAEKIDTAFREICKRNAEKPVSPGMGCAWETWYYEGLDNSNEQYYLRKIKKSENKIRTAIVIYTEMSGEEKWKVKKYAEKVFCTTK